MLHSFSPAISLACYVHVERSSHLAHSCAGDAHLCLDVVMCHARALHASFQKARCTSIVLHLASWMRQGGLWYCLVPGSIATPQIWDIFVHADLQSLRYMRAAHRTPRRARELLPCSSKLVAQFTHEFAVITSRHRACVCIRAKSAHAAPPMSCLKERSIHRRAPLLSVCSDEWTALCRRTRVLFRRKCIH